MLIVIENNSKFVHSVLKYS